jgi:putative endonuclease
MAEDKLYRKKLGTWGESLALEYLSAKGYQLLERNFHSRYGELDLIMKVDDVLIAVEVKTRRSRKYGYAEYSITKKKIQAIADTMTVYLDNNAKLDQAWQIDLVVIESFGSEQPEIIHYQNVSLDF